MLGFATSVTIKAQTGNSLRHSSDASISCLLCFALNHHKNSHASQKVCALMCLRRFAACQLPVFCKTFLQSAASVSLGSHKGVVLVTDCAPAWMRDMAGLSSLVKGYTVAEQEAPALLLQENRQQAQKVIEGRAFARRAFMLEMQRLCCMQEHLAALAERVEGWQSNFKPKAEQSVLHQD